MNQNAHIIFFIEKIMKQITNEIKLISINNETKEKEYHACQYNIDEKNYLLRIAKITPIKIGYFVTLWKRNEKNIIIPYSENDNINHVVIITEYENQLGCFIFNKQILTIKNIFSNYQKEGKRGIRIYLPWEIPTNKRTFQTQQWQIKYFIDLYNDNNTVLTQTKYLINNNTIIK